MNLAGIETVVRERLGLDPGALGAAVFRRAVEHRMRARAVATPEAYLGLLALDPSESGALVDALVVPETWFFRGGRALFDRLAGFVAGRADRGPSRILCVPCSTGEEPFSLAIALADRHLPPTAYQLDAVDISEAHLARAAAGRFTAFAFREPGADVRPLHFRLQADRWVLLPEVRAVVRFRRGNATDPRFLDDAAQYDLILCRNLFIYLTPEARQRATATLDRLLAPDGRLCLTPGEADRLPPGRFVADGPAEWGIYRRTDGERPVGGRVESSRPDAPGRPARVRVPSGEAGGQSSGLEDSTRPTTPQEPLAAARQLADAGQLAEARAACEQLARGGPDQPAVYTLLGVILQAQGHSAEAVEAFRKALYLDPDHAEALGHMVVICDRRGDTAQAAALRKRLARVTGEVRS